MSVAVHLRKIRMQVFAPFFVLFISEESYVSLFRSCYTENRGSRGEVEVSMIFLLLTGLPQNSGAQTGHSAPSISWKNCIEERVILQIRA